MIYFIKIKDQNLVKIGKANNPEKRLKQLQTSHPDSLELLFITKGDAGAERMFHNRFRAYHIRGEWFRYGKDIRTAIKLMNFPVAKLESEISDGPLICTGRPKLTGDKRLPETIRFSVKLEEKAKIYEESEKADLSVSSFIRKKLFSLL